MYFEVDPIQPDPEKLKLLKETQKKLEEGQLGFIDAVVDAAGDKVIHSSRVGTVLQNMLESRKVAKGLIVSGGKESLDAALLLPLDERLAKRREIIKDLSQDQISANYAAEKISIGEMAEGLGIPEVIYPTVVLTPENLDLTQADIGGKALDLHPLHFGNMVPSAEPVKVLTIHRGKNRRNYNDDYLIDPAIDWDRHSEEPVKFLGVFKERIPGTYTTDSGFVAKKESALEEGEWDQWVIRDQAGNEIARKTFIFDLNRVGEFYSYHHRTGRYGDTDHDMKYGVQHFPPGTVFQVRDDVKVKAYTEEMKPYEGLDTFTVKHVSYNSPRGLLITCVEEHPGVIDKSEMEEHRFAASHVIKIIKRGPGKVVIDPDVYPSSDTFEQWLARNDAEISAAIKHEGLEYPKLKRGEHLFYSLSSLMSLVTDPSMKFDESDNASKYINETLLHKFLVSTNCVRYVHLETLGSWSYGYNAVNVKKWKRWLKKNTHRIFYNLDQCEKQEKEEDLRRSNEMVWD